MQLHSLTVSTAGQMHTIHETNEQASPWKITHVSSKEERGKERGKEESKRDREMYMVVIAKRQTQVRHGKKG